MNKPLSPVHTKNDNYNDISIHTSERYRLFILSARGVCRFKFTSYSRMDSDWLSVFL